MSKSKLSRKSSKTIAPKIVVRSSGAPAPAQPRADIIATARLAVDETVAAAAAGRNLDLHGDLMVYVLEKLDFTELGPIAVKRILTTLIEVCNDRQLSLVKDCMTDQRGLLRIRSEQFDLFGAILPIVGDDVELAVRICNEQTKLEGRGDKDVTDELREVTAEVAAMEAMLVRERSAERAA